MYFKSNFAFQQLNRRYFETADKRRLSFQLSDDEFHALTQGNCHYCGDKPRQLTTSYNHSYTYNGIDRVDSGRGYTPGNCVSCCKHCNYMKRDMGLAEFAERILVLSDRLRAGTAPRIDDLAPGVHEYTNETGRRCGYIISKHDPPIDTSVPASNDLTGKALNEYLGRLT